MSSLILPGRSKLATALREPRLLVPGQIPVGRVRINWSDPIWRGLSLCWVAGQRVNLVDGRPPDLDGTSVRPGPMGPTQYFDETAGGSIYWEREYLTTSDGAGTGDLTMVAYANPAAEADFSIICGQKWDSGGSPYNQVMLAANSNDTFAARSGAFAFLSYSGYTSASYSDSKVDGDWHVFAGQRASTTHSIIVDGAVAWQWSTEARDVSDGKRYTLIGNGGKGTAVDAYNGQQAVVLMWNRALTLDEHARVNTILRSQLNVLLETVNQSPLIFDLGGGGGGSGAEVVPGVIDTALATLAPVIATGAAVAIPVTDVILTTFAPSLASGVIVDAPATDVAITAYVPTVETGVAVAAGATDIALAGHAPTIQTGVNVSIDTTDIAFDAYAPSLASGISVDVPLTDVTLATHVPTIGTGVNVSMPAVDFLLAAFEPIVVTDNAVTPPVANIAFASHAPSIQTGVNVAIPVTDLAVATHAPSLGVSVAIDIPVTAFAIDTLAPTIATGASVAVTASDIAIAAFAPSLPMGTSVAVPLTDIAFSAFVPRLGSAFIAGYPVLSVTADRQPSTVYANRRPKTIQ